MNTLKTMVALRGQLNDSIKRCRVSLAQCQLGMLVTILRTSISCGCTNSFWLILTNEIEFGN